VLLAEKQVGQMVVLTVIRGGRQPDVEVTLEERPVG
jgi:S1-C subfamily serine protease